MKRQYLASIFLMTVFIGSTAFTPQPAVPGDTYSSDACKVQVNFPGQWNEEVTEKDKVTIYKVNYKTSANNIYKLSTIVYNAPISEKDQYARAKGSLNDFKDQMDAEIESQSKWQHEDHEGVKAAIHLPGYKYDMLYRVLWVGQRKYQILVMGPESNFDEEAARAFLNSFKLL